ncbi:hypothetical protein Tco_0074010 [Tanacetum coccineum]
MINLGRGDDKEVIIDVEHSNPKDDNLIEHNKTAQILRINTDVFHFETLLCKAFKKFYYLSQIDVDVLTKHIPGFKTFKEYKDDWIHEWNNGIPWVDERPWTDDGVWTKPTNNIDHKCEPLRFKSEHAKWPTCNWKEDGYCNQGDLPGMIREGNSIRYQDYEWYETFEDSKLKNEALINKVTLEGLMNEGEEASDDAIMDHNAEKEKQGWFDKYELIKDDDDDIVIIEQSVKVNQKARILELKRRNHKDYCSDNPYAVSIKEDTAYSCPELHSSSTMERSIRGIQKNSYAIIKYKSWNILEYNNHGAHAKKPQYAVLNSFNTAY